MGNARKHHSPEEKVSILRRHVVEGVPVSILGDEYQSHPSVFYRGFKPCFANGAAAAGSY